MAIVSGKRSVSLCDAYLNHSTTCRRSFSGTLMQYGRTVNRRHATDRGHSDPRRAVMWSYCTPALHSHE